MAKFQFEKKQVLPAIGMAAASVGLFAYFVLKMTTPPPLQAAPQSARAGAQVASAQGNGTSPNAAAGTAGTPPDPLATIDPLLGPPTAGMRDPFTPEIVDSGTLPRSTPVQVATNNLGQTHMPGVPTNLPSFGGSVPPMSIPSGPNGGLPGLNPVSTPQWTVTGVLSDSAEPQNRIAILRSGDARRFVKLGDMVDSTFRLVDVSRNGVVISDGSHRIHLLLGGDKKTAAHVPVASGAATGPWTGLPNTPAGAAQPAAAQPNPAQPGIGQPASIQAPAQTPAEVPGPAQAAPTGGLL